MTRRKRTNVVPRSIGVVITVVLVLCFIGSRWLWVVVQGSDWAVAIRYGCLDLGALPNLGPDRTEWAAGWNSIGYTQWRYEHHSQPQVCFGKHPWVAPPCALPCLMVGWFTSVPLWIPLLLAAVPTLTLWYRARHRIPPGHCQTCGYNLTGNVSGRCPECGEPTVPDVPRQDATTDDRKPTTENGQLKTDN